MTDDDELVESGGLRLRCDAIFVRVDCATIAALDGASTRSGVDARELQSTPHIRVFSLSPFPLARSPIRRTVNDFRLHLHLHCFIITAFYRRSHGIEIQLRGSDPFIETPIAIDIMHIIPLRPVRFHFGREQFGLA